MSTLIFLLVILGVWLLYRYWPRIVLYFIRRHITKAQAQQAAAFRQAQESMQQQARQYRRRHRRKIDPSVGEYVEFEDIECRVSSSASDAATSADYSQEEQITDVEWEDL